MTWLSCTKINIFQQKMAFRQLISMIRKQRNRVH